MTTRTLLITIRGQSKAVVDRAADLLADHVKASATFVQAAVENFADSDGRTMDDPPIVDPTISVQDATIHLVPPTGGTA